MNLKWSFLGLSSLDLKALHTMTVFSFSIASFLLATPQVHRYVSLMFHVFSDVSCAMYNIKSIYFLQQVYYHSGGLRLNPNLYQCGKVCLSLLGTWHGKNSENWIPDKSTMLQVLVSIQALILNEKPFFNEPGYANAYQGEEGQRRSKDYNDNTFILSLKTMMYTLRKPPKVRPLKQYLCL